MVIHGAAEADAGSGENRSDFSAGTGDTLAPGVNLIWINHSDAISPALSLSLCLSLL